ncbi:hypothetical protein Tco_1190365, partial [Tanacetum coccineum]
IREPLRRMYHRLVAFTIAGRGQAPEKVTTTGLYYLRSMDKRTMTVPYLLAQYLFRNAEGRKQGARMSGGHFITCLAEHFGLITEESLRGLNVVVAMGPERQQVRAAARSAHVDPEVAKEGVQADPAPAEAGQAPQAPHAAAPALRTIPQRLLRLEEEVLRLRDSIGEQRVVLDRMSRYFARFTTWVVGRLGQLLDASGVTYPRYGDLYVPYQRRSW